MLLRHRLLANQLRCKQTRPRRLRSRSLNFICEVIEQGRVEISCGAPKLNAWQNRSCYGKNAMFYSIKLILRRFLVQHKTLMHAKFQARSPNRLGGDVFTTFSNNDENNVTQ